MNKERDKFLTEAMGECWHEYKSRARRTCFKCNHRVYEYPFGKYNNDFSTWEGFGICWEWAIKQEWWNEFIEWTWQKLQRDGITYKYLDVQAGFREELINPDRFADAVYKFLKGGVHIAVKNVVGTPYPKSSSRKVR